MSDIRCVICKEKKYSWQFHFKKKQKVCEECEKISGTCQYVVSTGGSCNKPTDIRKPYRVNDMGKERDANIWLCKEHEHSLDESPSYEPLTSKET